MKIVQWSMTIPANLHQDFIQHSQTALKPTWTKFGAVDYKLFKSETNPDKFIEQLFFPNNFDPQLFFQKVKSDPEAAKISQSYEQQFHATNIEKEIINQL